MALTYNCSNVWHSFSQWLINILMYFFFVQYEMIEKTRSKKGWVYALLLPRTRSASGVKWSGVGVHMFICLWSKKKFESYFSDWLTFSNLPSRTSCRIYRLALPLLAPEKLSSLSKSRIFIFNAHLTLFDRSMTSHNSIGKYRHLVNWLGTCGPVSIVSKFYQFQIVTVVLSVLSFDLASTASL